MKMKLKWQRGEVDLTAVAVSMLILSIIVAGTGSAMIYGRDILQRQELAKQVSYRLRGEMEEVQLRLDVLASARTFTETSRTVRSTQEMEWVSTDGVNDPVVVRFTRAPIQYIDLPETSQNPDYYNIWVTAEYDEPGLAGDNSRNSDRRRTMTLYSAFVTTRQG